MKVNLLKSLVFILFLTPLAHTEDGQLNGQAVELTIQKSKETREKIEEKKNRNPASLKSNINEFESLMNNESEKNWFKEIDKLSVE